MTLAFATAAAPATPLDIVDKDGFPDWKDGLSDRDQTWLAAQKFDAKLGAACVLPAEDGTVARVVVGWGDAAARARGRFHLGPLPGGLPAGSYRIETFPGDQRDLEEAALGWLLGSYHFRRYRDGDAPDPAILQAPEAINTVRIEAMANAIALGRDLINTPANDMSPADLEAAVRHLGTRHEAAVEVTSGDALLKANFPLIHTVGRAATTEPRLLDLRWGAEDAPMVTIVGKGVCFDTGGLNLKPGNSMGLMKKDMGGAATSIALAEMIMTLDLPVRLRLLIPAVENAVSGNAFRPGDILTARNGKTVEINNTDAEGRLVLADALALATEEGPQHLISLATLTGAARVAVGPDLAPFYTDDDGLAAAISDGAARYADPVWRMPFHAPYESMIEPGIADLDNAPSGGFAGSITAALFLRRFTEGAASYAHFDIYGWTPAAKPGRPKGGEAQAARAIFAALEASLAKT